VAPPAREADAAAPLEGWSRRTRLTLLAIGAATLLVGGLLVARTTTAQALRTEGREAEAAVAAALETARAATADAAEAARAAATTAGHAGAVVDAIAPRAGDLSAESVAAVVAAAEQLEALVAEGVPAEP